MKLADRIACRAREVSEEKGDGSLKDQIERQDSMIRFAQAALLQGVELYVIEQRLGLKRVGGVA